MSDPTPAERRAIDELSRLGQEHPTDPLSPAEQAAAAAIRDIGSWEYCNDEPDPRLAYREWLARLSRDVVGKLRPHLYREAVDVLDECADPRYGPIVRGIAWSASTLRHRADDAEPATGLEGRGDDH